MHSSKAHKTHNYSSNNKGEITCFIFMGKWESGELDSVARSDTGFLCVLVQCAYIKIFKYCWGSWKPTVGLASRTKPLSTIYFFQEHWIPTTYICFCCCIQHLWHAVLDTKLGPQLVELQNCELIPIWVLSSIAALPHSRQREQY